MAAKKTIDEVEDAAIGKFFKEGCDCGCSRLFSLVDIETHRRNMQELERSEKDLILLSFFHFQLHRDNGELHYRVGGKHVCRKTFLFLFDMSQKLLYTLKDHYLENGLVPRTHGNKNRMPANTHSINADAPKLIGHRAFGNCTHPQ